MTTIVFVYTHKSFTNKKYQIHIHKCWITKLSKVFVTFKYTFKRWKKNLLFLLNYVMK